MTISASEATVPVQHPDRFFIGGQWVTPSSGSVIQVIDSATEQVYLTVAEAQAADIDRAVTAAAGAFHDGPWPRLTHAERAGYLRALGAELNKRAADIIAMWPRESGVTAALAATGGPGFKTDFDMGVGGFKQSGIGREGGEDGLRPFLEAKAILLDGPTSRYRDIQL